MKEHARPPIALNKDKLIFLFLFLLPLFADAIYSISDFRAGIIYRGITYAVVLSYIVLLPLKRYKTLTFLCLYPLFLALCSSIVYGGLDLGITEGAKYSYLFAISILLISKSNTITTTKLFAFTTNVGFIASLLILIPFALGIGKPTYFDGAYGNKGFFSAQNDISITLATCLVIATSQYTSNKTTINLVKTSLIALSMIILGTRLALISALIIPFCFILQLRFKAIAIATVMLIVFASSLYEITASYLSFSTYENQKFENMSSLGDKGRMTLLAGANSFFEERSVIAHIFGSGTYEYLNQTFKNLSSLQLEGDMKAVEMDPIDLFGQFGIIFTATLYIYFFSLLFRLSAIPTKSKQVKAVMIALSLILLNSIFVGHTINNAIAAPIIATLICIATVILKERQNKYGLKVDKKTP